MMNEEVFLIGIISASVLKDPARSLDSSEVRGARPSKRTNTPRWGKGTMGGCTCLPFTFLKLGAVFLIGLVLVMGFGGGLAGRVGGRVEGIGCFGGDWEVRSTTWALGRSLFSSTSCCGVSMSSSWACLLEDKGRWRMILGGE